VSIHADVGGTEPVRLLALVQGVVVVGESDGVNFDQDGAGDAVGGLPRSGIGQDLGAVQGSIGVDKWVSRQLTACRLRTLVRVSGSESQSTEARWCWAMMMGVLADTSAKISNCDDQFRREILGKREWTDP
jgi:hypothetical protein